MFHCTWIFLLQVPMGKDQGFIFVEFKVIIKSAIHQRHRHRTIYWVPEVKQETLVNQETLYKSQNAAYMLTKGTCRLIQWILETKTMAYKGRTWAGQILYIFCWNYLKIKITCPQRPTIFWPLGGLHLEVLLYN